MIAFLSLWLAGWAIGELTAVSWVVVIPFLLIVWGLGLVPPELVARIAHDTSEHWAAISFGSFILLAFVWFPFWTLAGITVFRGLQWQLDGREIIAIQEGVLRSRRETGLRHQSQSFELSRVRNLRYAPEPTVATPTLSFTKSMRAIQVMLRAEGGSIAFDQEGQTHRFGIGLPEAEANRLITTIRERFKITDDGWEPLPVES